MQGLQKAAHKLTTLRENLNLQMNKAGKDYKENLVLGPLDPYTQLLTGPNQNHIPK